MKLADIRRDYVKSELLEEQLAASPFEQFDLWLKDAVNCEELFSDPTAMVLSTVAASGQPSQRTVLLKEFDPQGFVFYTNLGSRKAQEIAHNNQVCALFPWLPLERQVIIYGRAEKLSVAQATRYFLSRPEASQLAAWSSKQSQPISSRKLLEQTFSRMKQKFKDGKIPLPDFWGGYRIVPTQIEFWQGGGSRLHDRFMYQQDDQQNWFIQRLQP